MEDNGFLKINAAKVSYETIDGETLIINLENGNYYSLIGTGAEIWSIVERGASVDDIVETLDRRYTGERAGMEAAVGRLVADLQSEGLVVHAHRPVPRADVPRPAGGADAGGDRRPFEAPLLSKFTDMQDLLLLDPIHEVDDTGWPAAKGPTDG